MKGIFFSMILVFIIIFLIMFVLIQQSLIFSYSVQKSVENRINAMLGFYDSIIFDSKKSLEIVSKRAIPSATSYVVTSGIPLSSANESIAILMTNGTINGTFQDLMTGSTTVDWQNSIKYIGNLQGFQTNVVVKYILIQPADSFHISVTYTIYVNISDVISNTNFTKISQENLILSVENFEDPLYPLNTYGRTVNVLKQSPHWNNYSSSDLTNLKDDLNNSYYHPSLNGASFLDRLEGKYFIQSKYQKPYTIGLESFVNKDEIALSGLPVNSGASNIDYFYFSSSSVPAYVISGMPSNFRLDNETTIGGKTHLQIYNASAII